MNVVKDVFLKEESLGSSVSMFYGTWVLGMDYNG